MARTKRVKLNVVKVNGDYNFEFRKPNWADMPLLYLELLENKAKVKPEMRHIDYEPSGFDISSLPNVSQLKTNFIEDTRREIENNGDQQSTSSSSSFPVFEIIPKAVTPIQSDPILSQEVQPLIQFIPESSSHNIPLLHSSSSSTEEVPSSSIMLDGSPPEDDPILSILRGEKEEMSSTSNVLPSLPTPTRVKQDIPFPTLSQINTGIAKPNGHKDLTAINRNDEKELQQKRELLFKFKTLRRHYADVSIPDFTEYSDLQTMQREYDMLVRQLRVDNNVETYKKYLIVGFGLVEFVLSKFLKFGEIEGFTQQQMFGMNQYEKILVELGEKHQVEPSKQWSPELRLIGIIAMNAVIFVGTKMLFKAGSSSDILSMISNPPTTTTSKPKQSSSTQSSTSSSTMRGPDMSDLDQL